MSSGATRRDAIDLAVIDTGTGQVGAYIIDSADGPGYVRMLAWADAHAPGSRVWALEGTGSFAVGLAAFLAETGEDVVEVAAGKRTRGAKNDRIDAVRAARLSLLLKQDPAGPTLLAEPGVGPSLPHNYSSAGPTPAACAAKPRSPRSLGPPTGGSTGQRVRHRLSRSGDRDLNRALHTVAVTRMRCHAETRDYEATRTALGESHREIRRSPKRALARRLYRCIKVAVRRTTRLQAAA